MLLSTPFRFARESHQDTHEVGEIVMSQFLIARQFSRDNTVINSHDGVELRKCFSNGIQMLDSNDTSRLSISNLVDKLGVSTWWLRTRGYSLKRCKKKQVAINSIQYYSSLWTLTLSTTALTLLEVSITMEIWSENKIIDICRSKKIFVDNWRCMSSRRRRSQENDHFVVGYRCTVPIMIDMIGLNRFGMRCESYLMPIENHIIVKLRHLERVPYVDKVFSNMFAFNESGFR